MMYQLPIDMIARMISVPLAMKSPPFHSASSPYGFSTVSCSGAPGATAAGAGAAASAAGGAAGGAAAGAGAASAAGLAGSWAKATGGMASTMLPRTSAAIAAAL